MKKMLSLLTVVFALVAMPLFAADEKCCGKPNPTRGARKGVMDTDKCGCNANKPANKSCNSCGSCNTCKPCCGR